MQVGFSVPVWCKTFETLHDKQLDHFWRPPLASKFNKDVADWEGMSIGIKRRVKGITHVLTMMEPEVMDNVDDIGGLCRKVFTPETNKDLTIIYIMLDMQKAMEGVHTRSYGVIDSVLEYNSFSDPEAPIYISQLNDFINMSTNVVSKWRTSPSEYMSSDGISVERAKKALAKAIAGNVCAEAIKFNNLFSYFAPLKKEGILTLTCTTNDEVQVDENLHSTSFIEMYNVFRDRGLIDPLTVDEMYSIVNDFVLVDDKAAEWLLGNMSSEDKAIFSPMSVDDSKKYTRIIANSVLRALRYPPLYPDFENPYKFLDQSLIMSLGYFFDKDIVEYGLDAEHEYVSDSDIEC